jgi:hypothetical protein
MGSKRRHAEILIRKLARLLNIPIQVTTTANGKRLEQHCTRKCRELGFQVIDDSKKGLPHDLRVNGFRVQCKSRRKHGNNGQGVNLKKSGQRQYSTSHVDFFVIRFNRKCYVVPSCCIAGDDGLVCNWVNLAKLGRYIDAWSQLAGERVCVDVQTNLFARVATNGR